MSAAEPTPPTRQIEEDDGADEIHLTHSEILTIKPFSTENRQPVRGRNAPGIYSNVAGASTRQRGVLVIYTGGTLGMKRNSEGSLEPAAGYLTERMFHMSEFRDDDMPGVDLIETSPLIDSSDMTPTHWIYIANLVGEHYWDYDGFVVITGTDTMAYCASALSFLFENLGKPVILTGSMVPLCEIFNDARRNLIVALVIAAYVEVPEVAIFVNDKLLRGNRTSKINSMGLDAFTSPNFPPLAELATGFRLRKMNFLPMPGARFRVNPALDTNIAVWQMVPGYKDDYIYTAIEHTRTLRGIVLELYGTGNVGAKKKLKDAISMAISKGIAVVAASQCVYGMVDLDAYALGRNLKDIGVIGGLDMTTEAIVTKLAFLLSKPGMTNAKLHQLMHQNLRGELSDDPSRYIPHRPSADEFIGTVSSLSAKL
eukprot:gb/GECG01016769.1/.p1 GENE.gb/GECG01016769.1/~~gb/GECG01016769.1/.p1  ORF type:complete len:426 (+),score=43.85 gb/GECG01016769.1/:1-1278(+)